MVVHFADVWTAQFLSPPSCLCTRLFFLPYWRPGGPVSLILHLSSLHRRVDRLQFLLPSVLVRAVVRVTSFFFLHCCFPQRSFIKPHSLFFSLSPLCRCTGWALSSSCVVGSLSRCVGGLVSFPVIIGSSLASVRRCASKPTHSFFAIGSSWPCGKTQLGNTRVGCRWARLMHDFPTVSLSSRSHVICHRIIPRT